MTRDRRPITIFATREEMQRVEMALLLMARKPSPPLKAYRSCLAGSAQSNGRAVSS